MEFGRVPTEQLNKIDFTLPIDPNFNSKTLQGIEAKHLKAFVGCPKWGRKEWVGTLFPPKTKEKEYLDFYARLYNGIELNATHYKIYSKEEIDKWLVKVGKEDLIFYPKMYKGVTHFGSLRGKEFITKQMLESISYLGKHLGPIYIQVSESFAPKRKEELYDYLASLPTNFQYFVEVRHPEWFLNKIILKELIEKLRSLKIGIVITDTAGRRDCLHMCLTIPKTMIRFCANSTNDIDLKRIDDWTNRILAWKNKGLQELYFTLHIQDEADSPEFSVKIIDRFNELLGTKIKRPILFADPKTLFDN